MRILLLNGPNLGRLGSRQPEIYGSTTLAEIVAAARAHAEARGSTLLELQSNHEGDLIDRLEQRDYDGVVINPGALTHYGYALFEALVGCDVPVIEIHLSDLEKRAEREPWRRKSVVRPAVIATVMGKGWQGYLDAIDLLLDHVDDAPSAAATPDAARAGEAAT